MLRPIAAVALAAVLGLALPLQAQSQAFPTTPPPDDTPPPPGSSLALDGAIHRSSLDHSACLLGLLSYRYSGTGLGVGAYYQKTLVPQGVLRTAASIHDEFAVEGGMELRHHTWEAVLDTTTNEAWSYTEFAINVAAVWNVWFTPELAAYPKLGFGFGFGSVSPGGGYRDSAFGGLFGMGAVGLVYKINAFLLRAEVSNFSLGVGLGWSFL